MAEAKAAQPGPKAGASGAGSSINPYRAYNFRITVAQGDIVGHFIRCDGFGSEQHAIRYAEGGGGGHVYQLVGPVEYTEVRLHYGIISTHQQALWNWIETNRRTQRDRRNVMIDLLGPDPNDIYGYVLEEAWISKWSMGPLDSLGRDFAVESISIVYEGISRGAK